VQTSQEEAQASALAVLKNRCIVKFLKKTLSDRREKKKDKNIEESAQHAGRRRG
jgi:hypothetical protein